MKKCGQCKKELDEILFIKDEIEYKVCNKCRAYAKSYVEKQKIENPEKLKNQQKSSSKKYRESNLEKIREKDRLLKKEYRENNPELFKKNRAVYIEANKEKLKSYDSNRMIERPEYFLFSSARGRAQKYNREFSITEQDIKELLELTPICPLRKVKFQRGINQTASPNSPSLDRIDSLKGYTKDNIQIISYRANLIKNTIDLDAFEKIIYNFNYTFQEYHDTDDLTRKIILEDRLQQFNHENWDEKDKYRLLNIENWLINSAKKRAKRNNLEINIDVDYIKRIWPLDNKCPIINEKFKSGKLFSSKNSATIDRMDNSKGYVVGNIMIISSVANSIKNNASIEELEFILKNWKELEIKRNK